MKLFLLVFAFSVVNASSLNNLLLAFEDCGNVALKK